MARAVRVEVLEVQILDVRGDVGGSPGDEAIAAERDRRGTGQRGADDVEIRRRQVREYQVEGTRVPRCGSLASSGFPEAVRVPSTTQLFDPSDSVAPPPSRKSAASGTPPVNADAHAADVEWAWSFGERPVGRVGRVGGQSTRRVRPVRLTRRGRRHDRKPCRRIRGHQLRHPFLADRANEVVAQELERVVGAQIPGHHLDPDDDVGSGPRFRLEPQQRELERQRGAVVCGEERVHARHVGIHLLLRPSGCSVPRRLCRPAETHRPQETGPAAVRAAPKISHNRP